jgi:hypothetical protein
MSNEQMEPEIGSIYHNRVYPTKIVQITEVKDHFIIFQFLEGLPKDYPRQGLAHEMQHSQFIRYYIKQNN